MVFVLFILGDFVQLDGVHLWDNVRVDDGCKISKSILCRNVHIKRYFLLQMQFSLIVYYNYGKVFCYQVIFHKIPYIKSCISG